MVKQVNPVEKIGVKSFSQGEEAFAHYWELFAPEGLSLVRQFMYDVPNTKRRFDFAHPEAHVAVEIEGGMYDMTTRSGQRIRGHHVHPAGYESDAARYNEAAEAGWIVLRYTPRMIERDPLEAVHQTVRVIQARLNR